jgi:hypothetical protein
VHITRKITNVTIGIYGIILYKIDGTILYKEDIVGIKIGIKQIKNALNLGGSLASGAITSLNYMKINSEVVRVWWIKPKGAWH